MGSLIAIRLTNRLFAARDVFVTGHRKEKLQELANVGAQVELDNKNAAAKSDVVLIAVKPKHVLEVCTDISAQCKNKLIISIVAGITIDAISRILPSSHIIRAMPNMAATVGESFTGLSTMSASENEKEIARSIFESLGKCEFFQEEMLDAITGISGSGPAFLFYIANAMLDVARENGFEDEQARSIIAQTMLGAAKIMLQDERTLEEMVKFVASKGGTTEAGLKVAEVLGLDVIFRKVVSRAIQRAAEISEQTGR